MTSLITGGAGFIGSAVTRLLLERGESKPVIFSRNPNTPRLSDVADHIQMVAGDLGHFNHVLEAIRKTQPDVIYHLGAMLPEFAEADPAGAIRSNAVGTFHVLEAARLLDIPKVLFASSFGVYGDGIKEDKVDDFSPQFPNFMYGIT